MTISAHLDSLHKRHDQLKKEVRYAYMHHYSNEHIAGLKKKKLKVKDEIEGFVNGASNQNEPCSSFT